MMIRHNGLSGTPQDLVRGADSMLGKSGIQDTSWPYWWTIPRVNTQEVQAVNSIPAPVAATLTEVVSVVVPAGNVFVMRGIWQAFFTAVGGAPIFIDGSGDILWTIDVDVPIGSTPLSGYGLPYFTGMKEQRGSRIQPYPINAFSVFYPYQVIRYKVLTSAAIPAGAPNFITCGLFGWFDKLL